MTDEHPDPEIKRRRFIAMTGAAAGASALAGCGGGATATEQQDDQQTTEPGGSGETTDTTGSGGPKGGTFIDTSSQSAKTWDPRKNELAWVSSILPYIFDGLLISKPDGSGLVPHLAAEQPTKVNDTTWKVSLREGVKFHNGDELTADDVAYTYNWILDPANKSPRRANISFMKGVEVLGDYQVQFNLKNPFALFKLRLAEPIVPKSVADKMGPQKFGQQPVGTGPFKFADWNQSEELTLERHAEYFLKTPNLDQYKVRIIPEKQVQFVELATGGVTQASVPNELLQKAKKQQNIERVTIDSFDYNGIIFNPLREPFSNEKVRKAMHYAVDFEEMMKAAKGVLGDRPYGYMPKSVNTAWGFPWKEWDDQYFPEKDHQKAKQLLEEAGYGDGFGKTLDIKSLAFSDFKSMSVILQRELDKLGYKAEITEQTIGQWLETLNKDRYDAIDYGWTGGRDPDGFYYFLFRNLRNDDGFEPGKNFAGNTSAGFLYSAYPDAKDLDRLDNLVREARRITDRQKRKQMYTEAAEILQSRYPHLQVFSEKSAVAYRKEVQDYEVTSFSSQPACNEWHNAWIKK